MRIIASMYILSLHDALPILTDQTRKAEHFRALHIPGTPLLLFNIWDAGSAKAVAAAGAKANATSSWRSEEHTSELQSHSDLVCRLLLEKKKSKQTNQYF